MDASDAVLHYGRHGVDLSGRDTQDCAGLSSLLFVTLKQHFLVMLVDSCDGTPLTTRRRIFKTCGELEVIRRQTSTGEWLVQRKFLVTQGGTCCVLFGHPRKMGMKTAWAHFQAIRELLGTGRDLGHQGLLIEHTVLDRAIHTSLSRHMQEMSSMAHEVSSRGLSQTQAWLREQLTWTTSAGCTLHDLHNGFEKGMESYVEDKVFMRALYGGVEGLRDSYFVLVDEIGVWLPKAVRIKDWELPKQEQYDLWVLLGLPPTIVDAPLVLQMRFLGGRLCLAEDMDRCPQSAQLLTTTLVSLWEFREWTDSRWATMGSTSRRMVIAYLTGIGDLVSTLRSMGEISEYYVKSFVNLADGHRRACVVGGVAGPSATQCCARCWRTTGCP